MGGTLSGPAAPPGGAIPDPGPVPPRRPGPIARLENLFFPPLAGRTTNPRGVLSAALPEGPGLLLALVMGLVVAGILEVVMLAQPIPPGGDPGEWTATAYAYVGLSY